MKKALLMAALSGLIVSQGSAQAQDFQRKCGLPDIKNALIAKDPSFKAYFEAYQQSQKDYIAEYKSNPSIGALQRSTAIYPVPVVFHFVVDSSEYNQIGGAAGIAQRVTDQVAVLNRDFNRQNGDSTGIPSVFKPYYANANIQFGLAHTKPDGSGTPGYDITIVSSTVATNIANSSGNGYNKVKAAGTGGVDPWDNTKYLNIWVTNTGSGGNMILGLTIPPSFAGSGGFPSSQKGIVLAYAAVGVQNASTTGQYFISGITGGRTLTHEMGHYFEIWHTWGDDNGLCPNTGGADDNIADTPPQADATYGNPSFPKYDSCSKPSVSNGIMFMNYMDYVNDNAMRMFTKDQAIIMQQSLNSASESYSLTQHPELLQYPTAVANVASQNNFDIYPNPTTGFFNVAYNGSSSLKAIQVLDMMGKNVKTIHINNQQSGIYSIDLSEMSKGIYFVQCQFEEGVISRKIVLQ